MYMYTHIMYMYIHLCIYTSPPRPEVFIYGSLSGHLQFTDKPQAPPPLSLIGAVLRLLQKRLNHVVVGVEGNLGRKMLASSKQEMLKLKLGQYLGANPLSCNLILHIIIYMAIR
jgi:hypothetical protein